MEQYLIPKAINGYQMGLVFQTFSQWTRQPLLGMDIMLGKGVGDNVMAKRQQQTKRIDYVKAP